MVCEVGLAVLAPVYSVTIQVGVVCEAHGCVPLAWRGLVDIGCFGEDRVVDEGPRARNRMISRGLVDDLEAVVLGRHWVGQRSVVALGTADVSCGTDKVILVAGIQEREGGAVCAPSLRAGKLEIARESLQTEQSKVMQADHLTLWITCLSGRPLGCWWSMVLILRGRCVGNELSQRWLPQRNDGCGTGRKQPTASEGMNVPEVGQEHRRPLQCPMGWKRAERGVRWDGKAGGLESKDGGRQKRIRKGS